MSDYIVYKHTTPNDKIYIGITKQTTKRRWRNGYGYKGQFFYKAIEKYGWNNIKHEILYENLSEKQAKVLEISLIHYYKSNDTNYGYNITVGGDTSKGRVITEELREKLRKGGRMSIKFTHTEEANKKRKETMTGRTLSEAHKQKVSKNHANVSGVNNPMYGKCHTKETRQKISAAQRKRKVICLTTGEIFDSIATATAYYNLSRSSIKNNVTGRRKSAGKLADGTKLVWQYYDEE